MDGEKSMNEAARLLEETKQADPTVIIGFAGGYMQMQLNRFTNGEVRLEFFTMKTGEFWEMSDNYELDSSKTMKFNTTAEAWAEVGKQVGWIQS